MAEVILDGPSDGAIDGTCDGINEGKADGAKVNWKIVKMKLSKLFPVPSTPVESTGMPVLLPPSMAS